MAVEIPVYVNIEQAFKDAAARLPEATKPLQQYLDNNTLAIQLRVDEKQKMMVKDLLEDSTLSAEKLKFALADVEAKLATMSKNGGLDLSTGLKYSEQIMLQAYGALEYKINGVTDASKIMTKIYEANIDRSKIKIQELTDKIDYLTKKQNQYYQVVDGKRVPGGRAFEKISKDISLANRELTLAKTHLGNLYTALESVSVGGKKAATNVAMIKTPAMLMADEFRRGAQYVAQLNTNLGVTNGRLATLIKSSLSLVALHMATSFIRNVRQVTSEFEMQRVALGGIIQDTERAEKLFQQIKAAAIKSPFEIKDLVTFTKQLSAYRIETENLFGVTMRLADISAGLGVDMNRLVLAYGQVRAASVLRGQELRQFTEAGIPLVELLANKFEELGRAGTTTADVFELISQRAVPFSMIEDIFNDMTDAGGMFYKMQEKQSETLKGQWMKLRDALSIMYDEIGNTGSVHAAMEGLIKSAMNLLQNWREVAKNVKIAVAAFAAYKLAIVNTRIAETALTAAQAAEISALELNTVARSRLIATIFGETAATKVQIAIGNLSVAVKRKEAAATNLLSKSLARLTLILLSNPYAIAIAGLTILLGLLIKSSMKAKEAAISIDEFKKSIESFNEAKGHAKDVEDLCTAYDKLSSKAERTKEEEKKLARITKDLAKSYPQAISGVNEHTKAIELDTKAIRERNAATLDAIKLSFAEDKRKAEQNINELEDEYARIGEILARGTIKKGAYGGEWFEPITEEQRAAYGNRLRSIEKQLGDFKEAANDAEESIEDFNGEIEGPPPPEFFGNAWKLQLSNFSVTIEDTLNKTTKVIRAFQNDQIKGFADQKEALEETAKEYNKYTALIKFYNRVLETATGKRREQTQQLLNDALALQGVYAQILTEWNAWDLVNKSDKGSGGSYKKDPFITLMEERMKFMKDFKKGYEDLNKFMSSSMAQETQAGIMMGRGMSLGLSAEEQLRSVKELTSWYSDMIQEVEQKLRDKGIRGNTVTDFLSVDTTTKSRAVQDLQKLLQSLWDAKTDLDTSEKKKEFEEAIKKLAEDIKRSETAKNFFENVLGATGDKEIATNLTLSLYGEPGEELGERIKEDIERTLQELKIPEEDSIYKKLMEAADKQDFRDLVKDIKSLPEQLQPVVLRSAQAIEKYNSQTAQSYVKLLYKFDELAQKRIDIEKQADDQIKTLREGLALELKGIEENESIQDKAAAKAAAQAREKAAEEGVERERELKLFQLKRDYRLFFESVGTISLESARKIARAERLLIEEQFNAGQISIEKYYRELSRIDERLKKYENDRNPIVTYLTKGFDGLFDKIRQVGVNLTALTGNLKDDEGNFSFPEGLEKTINVLGAIFGGKFFGVENVKGRKNVFDKMKEQLGENEQEWQKMSERTEEKLMAMSANWARGIGWADFWVNFAGNGIKAFDQLAQKSKNVEGDVKEGWNKAAKFLMTSAAGMFFGAPITAGLLGQKIDLDDAWERLTSLNEKAMSGFEKFKSGDFIGALIDNIEGWSEVFGKNTKKIDRAIKDQASLIEDLEYSYSRLDVAIQKAFGSDYIYNYNKQLETLQAQAEAYRKQAELEYSKGSKKRDQNKIDEYNKQARDIEDKIADMQTQLSEFMTGTDLTSAAKEFAESWIEAYKEFGSTTDAMKEKFNDMIENMVVNSLAAQLIQGILQPIFDQIDTASRDGELSAQEIAAISEQIPSRVDMINNAMSTMMNELLASGVNLRDQASSMTGISRSIAGASEESINGLAAGINTQNFYMQHIDANVTAILATLTGGTTTAGSGTTGEYVDPYKDEMLTYVGSLPQMRDDMASIRDMLEKVIRPNGTTATHYVAARM